MHKRGEADAFLARAGRVLSREALPFALVIGESESALHERIHVHQLVNGLASGGCLALANVIAPPELFRSQTHGRGDPVHVPLERKNTLRRAETAECAVRRMIGGHGAAA